MFSFINSLSTIIFNKFKSKIFINLTFYSIIASLCCTIDVEPYDGLGTINFEVFWDQELRESASINGKLDSSDDIGNSIEFTITGDQNSYINNSVPSGYYTFTINLYNNNEESGSAVKVISILPGETIFLQIYIIQSSTNDAPEILILSEIDRQIIIEFSGNRDSITMSVAFTIIAKAVNVSDIHDQYYIWILDNKQTLTGFYADNYTIPDNLAIGNHQIDVVILNLNGYYGSAGHTFKVVNNAYSSSLEPPISLNAETISSNQIYLTWQDNSNEETGFRIERAMNTNFTAATIIEVPSNTSFYYDECLIADTQYYYRIGAFNNYTISFSTVILDPKTLIEKNYYIRSDAMGLNNGTDWDNAWNELPDILIRGSIYYIADGDYSSYTFDDNASETDYICIKKATISDHGTDTGWDNSYGDGKAIFGPLVFTDSYYFIDGYPERDFKIVGGYKGHIISIQSSKITIRNCELDGNFIYENGYQTDGACTGVGIGDTGSSDSSYITIENCEIHNIADDGFQIYNTDHIYIRNNEIHTLYACGTDGFLNGPCNNGHSDSIEIFNLQQSEFTSNFIYDSEDTNAAFFFGNVASNYGGYDVYCKDILLTNNIFYTPNAGFVVYLEEADRVKLYNNVIWGRRKGSYGGLSIGDVRNLDMYNNIILSIYYDHVGGEYDPANHRGDYNLFGITLAGQYPVNAHDIVDPDPGFSNISGIDGPDNDNPQPEDFILLSNSPCINKGYSGDSVIEIPGVDFFGNIRDNSPDIGAIEYIIIH